MKALGVAALGVVCLTATSAAAAPVPAWRGYGGDAQHNANAPAASQSLTNQHWSLSIDDTPQSGEILIHYASPMITKRNTVLVPVKHDSQGAYRIEAHDGATGNLIWQANSNYLFAPHDWTPSVPAHLTAQNKLYYAARGGVVLFRDKPDLPTGKTGQRVARFRQINMDDPNVHHDALEFPDGQIVLVTRLVPGQRATVLQLPATPQHATAADTTADRESQPIAL